LLLLFFRVKERERKKKCFKEIGTKTNIIRRRCAAVIKVGVNDKCWPKDEGLKSREVCGVVFVCKKKKKQ